MPVGGELGRIGAAAAPAPAPRRHRTCPDAPPGTDARPRQRRAPAATAPASAPAGRTDSAPAPQPAARRNDDAPRTSPRWCESWPPRTASTWPRQGHRSRRAHPQARRAGRRREREGADRREHRLRRHRQRRAPAPAAVPSPLAHLRGTTQKANRIRQITARKTRESLQATAQLTQTHEVDMTKIVALRARAKKEFAEREGVNLTYLPFIARAVDRRTQGAPEHQRQLQRGDQRDHLLRRRAPRVRGGHRSGPALTGGPQRR